MIFSKYTRNITVNIYFYMFERYSLNILHEYLIFFVTIICRIITEYTFNKTFKIILATSIWSKDYFEQVDK